MGLKGADVAVMGTQFTAVGFDGAAAFLFAVETVHDIGKAAACDEIAHFETIFKKRTGEFLNFGEKCGDAPGREFGEFAFVARDTALVPEVEKESESDGEKSGGEKNRPGEPEGICDGEGSCCGIGPRPGAYARLDFESVRTPAQFAEGEIERLLLFPLRL